MSKEIKEQIPDWYCERQLPQVEKAIAENGEYVMDWAITKKSMIAYNNWMRAKGFKVEWIEKRENQFLVKITKPESKMIIGDDNVCPITKEQCRDECCSPGSICNLSGTQRLQP